MNHWKKRGLEGGASASLNKQEVEAEVVTADIQSTQTLIVHVPIFV